MAQPDPSHCWNIYGKHMSSIGHGYALWDPQPEQHLPEIELGAVGWLDKGKFRHLFNTTKTEDDPINTMYGVPEGFVQLVVSPAQIRSDQKIKDWVLFNRTIDAQAVNAGANLDTPLTMVSAGAKFEFRMKSDTGALLVLEPPARIAQFTAKLPIVRYLERNHSSWLSFANYGRQGRPDPGLDVRLEDLMFISGTTKTTQWFTTVFSGRSKGESGSISLGASGIGSLSFSLSNEHQAISGSRCNFGPDDVDRSAAGRYGELVREGVSPLKPTQNIFVNYYKMKRRIWRYHPMQAAAGPHELPPGDDRVEDGSSALLASGDDVESSGFEEVPPRSVAYDTVTVLLDWILDHSDADIAIASDTDLYAIFRGTEIPDDVRDGLEQVSPPVQVDEHGVGIVVVDLPRSEAQEPHETVEVEDHGETLHEASLSSEADWKGSQSYTHHGPIKSLATSPNSEWIASASDDGRILLWSARERRIRREWQLSSEYVAFSPDSRHLASAGTDGGVTIWDLTENDPSGVLEGHTDLVNMVAWSPDGTKLVSCSEDGTVRVWNPTTHQQKSLLEGQIDPVIFSVFSPDGTMIASGGGNSTCHVWDVETGALRVALEGRASVSRAQFGPDSERLAAAYEDGGVRIWKIKSEEVKRGQALAILYDHQMPVSSIAFSPDGTMMALGSGDSTVTVYDATRMEKKFTLTTHDMSVNSVQFSPDSKYIASASDDSTVRLWSAESGTCETTFNEHSGRVTHVLFSPDGRLLVSGADDTSVLVRKLETVDVGTQ
ncbi:WD40-repeat-containing domain protein [Daedaleopsis nitida]|nr:WD40-repeat-containing domain protein [Daedaleopsis nitida]